jgi:NADH-quinone oxidoreductase subunit I
LLSRKEQLSKSNEYYHKIHPVEAAAVDKGLADAAAAADAKKKAAVEAAAKAAAAKEVAKAAPVAPTGQSQNALPRPNEVNTQATPGSTSAPGATPPETSSSSSS